jgi:hypothetical protein
MPPTSEQAKARGRNEKGDHLEAPRGRTKPDEEEEEGVNNGESRNATSLKMLQYHNGAAVQTAPRIYLVFWGPNWFTGGDPNGVATRLHLFYQGLGGSSFANVLKQYSGSMGAFTNPTGQYKGWIQDTTPVPAQPTKADMANAAKRASTRVNDYGYNTQFVIATPWGVVDQFSTQKSFCAWHDWTYGGPTGNWITYTSMPYMPYMQAIGRGCGAGWVNGSNGTLDGVTILASHEYEESVNDPGLNAWYDADGDENADKCSWTNLGNVRLTNGYSFPVQPAWSNSYRNTYGNGCLFSS